ncbi:hypothetical protein A3L23_01250 [Rhodococcoides fascians D188]|nr:hypothetical protein A3L23_01250 [Rhodococcus fascians D188]
MSKIIVDIVGRTDMRTKSGGDTFQIEQYASRLQTRGVDCRLVEYSPRMALRANSIVHLVNTARPFDLLDSIQQAGGHKIVVSPIHHSLTDIAKMRMAEPGTGLRTIVGKIANESVRELIASTVRLRSAADIGGRPLIASALRNVPRARALWKRVGMALDGAEAVFTLSATERGCLIADTGWSGANEIRIPNGRPDYPGDLTYSWKARSPVLLSVGRIEPRKRQLEAATICASEGIPAKFIGSANPATERYVSDFQKVVRSSPLLTWEGEESHETVVTQMRSSRVFINCSWVEVQSLVDIEANTAGCRIYATDTGSTSEYLFDSTQSYPLDDLRSLLLSASECANESQGVEVSRYPYTWDMAADQLFDEYTRVAGF